MFEINRLKEKRLCTVDINDHLSVQIKSCALVDVCSSEFEKGKRSIQNESLLINLQSINLHRQTMVETGKQEEKGFASISLTKT